MTDIFGDNNANSIEGTDQHDVIFAGGGDDTVFGGEGFDAIDGGPGNDLLFGGIVTTDELIGSNSNFSDWIRGGDGDDTIVGGNFVDVGFALPNGAPGDALVQFMSGYVTSGSPESLWGQGGNDHIYGGSENDTIGGSVGDDILSLRGGDDVAYGGPGNDLILGFSGHDLIYGGDGNDRIYASTGNDTVWGGAGDDTIYGDRSGESAAHGSSHADTFLFISGHGNDVIMDFTIDDILDISPLDAGFSSLADLYAATEDAVPVSEGYNFALLIHTSETDSILLQFIEETEITALTILI